MVELAAEESTLAHGASVVVGRDPASSERRPPVEERRAAQPVERGLAGAGWVGVAVVGQRATGRVEAGAEVLVVALMAEQRAAVRAGGGRRGMAVATTAVVAATTAEDRAAA